MWQLFCLIDTVYNLGKVHDNIINYISNLIGVVYRYGRSTIFKGAWSTIPVLACVELHCSQINMLRFSDQNKRDTDKPECVRFLTVLHVSSLYYIGRFIRWRFSAT